MKRKFILLICLFISLSGRTQIAEKLWEAGMENIRVNVTDGNTTAAFENTIYRGTYRGIGKALTAVLGENIPGDLELVVLDNGIPQLVICLPAPLIQAYREKKIPIQEVYRQMTMSCNTDKAMQRLKDHSVTLNRSVWKPDLVIYPQVRLENSSFDVLYTYAFNLAPALEISPWKGAKITAQVIFPIATNLKGEYKKIRPGILTLAQEIRFPHNIFGRLVAGNFTNHRLGGQAEISYRHPRGWLEVGAQAGTTVQSLITEQDGWYVSTEQRGYAALKATLYERRLNLQADMQGIRYLYGDYGLRGDLTRHFGEYAIGLFGMYNEGEINGGFHIAIPLPGRKWKRHRGMRIKPAEYFTGSYNMVSWGEYIDRKMGESYTTRPDDNRSSHFYQPDYIRYFLIKEE